MLVNLPNSLCFKEATDERTEKGDGFLCFADCHFIISLLSLMLFCFSFKGIRLSKAKPAMPKNNAQQSIDFGIHINKRSLMA